MNVLQFSTWNERCGIADYTASLVKALAAREISCAVQPVGRHEVGYLTRDEIRDRLDQVCVKAAQHDLIHIQHEFSFFVNQSGRLDESIKNFGYLLARLHKLGKPVIVTYHSERNFMNLVRVAGMATKPKSFLANLVFRAGAWYYKRMWKRHVARYHAAPHCRALVHTKTSRLAYINVGIPRAKITTIPMQVETGYSAPSDAEQLQARQQLGLPEDAVLLAIFGFLVKAKGYEVALDALLRLPKNYQLLIVGGPHPENTDAVLNRVLIKIRRHKQLQNRVHITGYVNAAQKAAFQAASDVFLAPYVEVGQSGSASIYSALASGRPTITTKTRTLRELHGEDDCFVTVAEEAPDELAWQIKQLVADRRRQLDLASRARVFVARQTARCHDMHARIYEELLKQPSTRRTLAQVPTDLTEMQPAPTLLPDVLERTVKLRENRYVTFVLPLGEKSDDIIQFISEKSVYPWDRSRSMMMRLLRPGQTFLDVGAHIGTYSLAAATLGCRVIAVEGCPENARFLRASVERNGFSNVQVIHAAAASCSGSVRFFPNRAWGHVVLSETPPAHVTNFVDVRAVTVDRLLDELNCPRVDLIKIDVVGSELDVLNGMQELLARPDAPPLFFESNAVALEVNFRQTPQAIFQKLADFGYRIYWIGRDEQGTLLPVDPADMQPEACTDFFACKGKEAHLFPIDTRSHRQVLATRVLIACEDVHPTNREYTFAQLETGPRWLREEPILQWTLQEHATAKQNEHNLSIDKAS